jgi:probable phosphoglycerate mutase
VTSSSVLYLVRHGESLGNVTPGSRRSDDPALTARGREQAARAAAALSRVGIDVVLSSPLRRARETADAIAAGSGVVARPVDGFAEVDMGALADADDPAARAERDAILSAWLAGEVSRSFPGGEDFTAVQARVRAGLRTVARELAGRRIALVTHRVPLVAARSLCLPDAVIVAPGAPCANGSITTLRADGERWHLVAWGEARHLA